MIERVTVVKIYASESWTVAQRTVDRIQMFIGKCLRRILSIGLHWTDRITNRELWKTTSKQPVLDQSFLQCFDTHRPLPKLAIIRYANLHKIFSQ